jgi:hypothetical protein
VFFHDAVELTRGESFSSPYDSNGVAAGSALETLINEFFNGFLGIPRALLYSPN